MIVNQITVCQEDGTLIAMVFEDGEEIKMIVQDGVEVIIEQ